MLGVYICLMVSMQIVPRTGVSKVVNACMHAYGALVDIKITLFIILINFRQLPLISSCNIKTAQYC